MAKKKKSPVNYSTSALPFGPKNAEDSAVLPYLPAGNDSPYQNPIDFSAPLVSFPSSNPQDYGPGSVFQPGPYAPQAPTGAPKQQVQYKPGDLKTLGYLAPLGDGLGAASQVQPTTDASDAVVQSLATGATGALSGASTGAMIGAMGGPLTAAGGALIGGVSGLVMGGIQSYLGLKRARSQRREQEKQTREIQAREDRREALARSDAKEAQGYSRRQNAIQSQWNAMNYVVNQLNNTLAQDQNLKDRFLQLGR